MSAAPTRNRLALIVTFLLIIGIASWLGDFLGQPTPTQKQPITNLDWGELNWPSVPSPTESLTSFGDASKVQETLVVEQPPVIAAPSAVSPLATDPNSFGPRLLAASPSAELLSLPPDAIRVVNVRQALGMSREQATLEQRQKLDAAIAAVSQGTPVRVVLDSSALTASTPPLVLYNAPFLDWTDAVTSELKRSHFTTP